MRRDDQRVSILCLIFYFIQRFQYGEGRFGKYPDFRSANREEEEERKRGRGERERDERFRCIIHLSSVPSSGITFFSVQPLKNIKFRIVV